MERGRESYLSNRAKKNELRYEYKRYLSKVGQLPDDILKITLCREFGWTSQEYDEQPQHFIDAIIEKMTVDAEESNKETKYKK